MMERVEANKACWDKLTSSQAVSRHGDDITNNNSHPSHPTVAKKQKLDDHLAIDSERTSKSGANPASQTLNGHSSVPDSPSDPPSHVSQHFPSISHALAWVTHGRDDLCTPPDDSLPAMPHWLKHSQHVQVLITGSFHLVGGVLTVIDPHMND